MLKVIISWPASMNGTPKVEKMRPEEHPLGTPAPGARKDWGAAGGEGGKSGGGERGSGRRGGSGGGFGAEEVSVAERAVAVGLVRGSRK